MTTSIPLCPTSFAAFLIFHYTSPILPVHSELLCNFPVQLFRKSGRLCAVEFPSFAGKHICTGCRVTILPFVQPKTFGKCFSICQFGQICQHNMHKDISLHRFCIVMPLGITYILPMTSTQMSPWKISKLKKSNWTIKTRLKWANPPWKLNSK